MDDFNGKSALITGGGSGIGRSIAVAFALRGARVAVSDVDDAGGRKTVEMIQQAGGQAMYVHADVSRPGDCHNLVEQVTRAYQRLDCACNNAGIGGEISMVADLAEAGWDRVIAVNLSGVFYCMHYEIPAMLAAGGSIVNMASILGQVGFAGASAYVSAKHGVVGLTRTAALEYSKAGIRINAVGPAFIHTPMIAGVTSDPQAEAALVSDHPIGRLGRPEEVAELVVWLCSDKASFVTGGYYAVDGGYLAH